jgi:hypothetical protein
MECCGSVGPVDSSLPNAEQAFVQLTVDRQRNLAQMTFLRQDLQAFRGGFTSLLTNGMIFQDHIEFGEHLMPPMSNQVYLNYTVSNSVNTLRIDGMIIVPCDGCPDIPTAFTRTNVVAVLASPTMIRVSEVEVSWDGVSNKTYQIQYRSALTTNM